MDFNIESEDFLNNKTRIFILRMKLIARRFFEQQNTEIYTTNETNYTKIFLNNGKHGNREALLPRRQPTKRNHGNLLCSLELKQRKAKTFDL